MKTFFIVTALILISTSLIAAEKLDNKEKKVTVTSVFEFEAGDVLSEEEISEMLNREMQNQEAWESSRDFDMQNNKYIEEAKRTQNK